MNDSPLQTTEISSQAPIDLAPRLKPRTLTIMLAVMCCVPVATIAWLWVKLPPASVESLEARIIAANFPPESFYKQTVYEKEKLAIPPTLAIENIGDQEWTLVFVQINKWYQFSETHNPVKPSPDGRLEIPLTYCFGKDGTTFDPTSQPIRHVRIFARLPNNTRGTYSQEFNFGT